MATKQSRDHDSFLFIVQVLLGQTIDNSFYISKWLPWSSPTMSSLFIKKCCHIPLAQQSHTLIYGKLWFQRYKGHVLLAQTVLPNDVRVQRSLWPKNPQSFTTENYFEHIEIFTMQSRKFRFKDLKLNNLLRTVITLRNYA